MRDFESIRIKRSIAIRERKTFDEVNGPVGLPAAPLARQIDDGGEILYELIVQEGPIWTEIRVSPPDHGVYGRPPSKIVTGRLGARKPARSCLKEVRTVSPTKSLKVYRNRILDGLDGFDLTSISPHLTLISLTSRQRLEAANRPIETVFFFETGLASVVATSRNSGKQAEMGVLGFEGMSGLAVIGGASQSPNHTVMQTAGTAHTIDSARLRQLMARSATMTARFALFALAFHTQTEQALLGSTTASVEQRLARWLLMAQDRLGDSHLALTHDTLGQMLGVRRSGVTIAVQRLEVSGLIKTTRGAITILSRDKALALVGDFYGLPEAEYERLFAPCSSIGSGREAN